MVPYAWQGEGATIEVFAMRSTYLKVLGFLNVQKCNTSPTYQSIVTLAPVANMILPFRHQIILQDLNV
jgi:hypothetical protein